MDRSTRDKEVLLLAIARTDPIYQRMMQEGAALEQKFEEMISELENEKRDLAWDFVMLNEDISQYIIYLACRYMDFKDLKEKTFIFSDDYRMRRVQAEITAKRLITQKE